MLSKNNRIGAIGRVTTMPRKLAGPGTIGALLGGGTAGGSARSGGSGSGRSGNTAGASGGAAESFESLYKRLLEMYKPELMEYEAVPEDKLRTDIAEWLRPGYDAAIETRQEQTDAYQAELDADALSRGMGASTYVTDVKARQMDAEAQDIRGFETEYVATLAKNLSAALESERERALEVEKVNNERKSEAQQQAYSAALALYGRGAGGSSGSSGGGGRSGASSSGGAKTSQVNVERFLSGLTPAQRRGVYTAANEANRAYRDEIIRSVGVMGYLSLQQRYKMW